MNKFLNIFIHKWSRLLRVFIVCVLYRITMSSFGVLTVGSIVNTPFTGNISGSASTVTNSYQPAISNLDYISMKSLAVSNLSVLGTSTIINSVVTEHSNLIVEGTASFASDLTIGGSLNITGSIAGYPTQSFVTGQVNTLNSTIAALPTTCNLATTTYVTGQVNTLNSTIAALPTTTYVDTKTTLAAVLANNNTFSGTNTFIGTLTASNLNVVGTTTTINTMTTETSNILITYSGPGIALDVKGSGHFSSNLTLDNGITINGTVSLPNNSISNSAISGLAASATTDATNATNISSGTLSVARGGTGATATTGTGNNVLSTSPTFTGTVSAANVSASGPITSTVATGTAPLSITSSTLVNNLNVQYLNGEQGSYYAPLASPSFTGTPLAPTATAGLSNQQIATTAFVQTTSSNLLSTNNTWSGNNTFNNGTLIANTLTSTTNGARQFYQNSTPMYGEGIVTSWGNTTSASFDISTLFPAVYQSGSVTVSIQLQVTSGTGSVAISGMYNILRNNGTWTFVTVNELKSGAANSVTLSNTSSTTISISNLNTSSYGYAWARVVCHG